jgi:hypothetical protein
MHVSQVQKPDIPEGTWWIWNRDNHPFHSDGGAWVCMKCGKSPAEHWEKIEPSYKEDSVSSIHEFRPMSGDSVKGGLPPVCTYCGRESNDYEYHLKPADFADKVAYSSGATSGGIHAPYFLMAWEGVPLGALRYEYGNQKHEDGQNVLAEANWLKAFHARDLKFFQDRAAHAIDHIRAEMSGHLDKEPGGNWGAVIWCADVMPFVAKYDPDFYAAVIRLRQHPGKRTVTCTCPRCHAANHQPPLAGESK